MIRGGGFFPFFQHIDKHLSTYCVYPGKRLILFWQMQITYLCNYLATQRQLKYKVTSANY